MKRMTAALLTTLCLAFPMTVMAEDTHYPVTVITYNAEKEPIEITFEKAPEKVLAICQNSIETMLALGLEDRIVASATLDTAIKEEYSEAFEGVEYLGEDYPDKESVIMMEPDFIMGWKSLFGEKTLGEVDYWIDQGINTYIFANAGGTSPRTLENEYTDILNIGKIFDVEDKAEALVDEIKDEVAKVKEAAETAEEKKSVVALEVYDDSIYVYGEDQLVGDMILQLGAELALPEGGDIGAEDLVALNPDVIFVIYMDREHEGMSINNVEMISENEVFQSLDAVKNGTVNAIRLSDCYASGPRTVDGIRSLAQGIYQELFS